MFFEFILLIILFSYLRKKLKTKILLPDWDKKFQIGLFISIALLVMHINISELRPILTWVGYGFISLIVYVLLTRKEFKPVKSLLYAWLPVLLVNLTEDLVLLVSKDLNDAWENYFGTAFIFSVVWLIAMLIINNKQQKAVEKELLKAAELEKEFRASEAMKAILEDQVTTRTAELTKQTEELQQALRELKSTQAQLIQSEKMASLGELTAGIAHEIQNPLNFVNNFSEVSEELVDEMNEELENGDIEEAKSIGKDLKENLSKINHHGKRADAIVKGMLEHSRSNKGEKALTDINALTDEFVRHSYHGLRVKEKDFTAEFKLDLDPDLPKLNVVASDISRVILNLVNNAFYAVHEKAKLGVEGFKPEVVVRSKKTEKGIEISVSDNGNGIPDEIKDKIFQPFFTTKPTGQGTGLGLSLSYDIIKAHGGEFWVDSKPGETRFYINLML